MMYASRNQFLVGADRRGYDYRKKHKIFVRHQPCRPEILQPPDMFLTRTQARKKTLQQQGNRDLKRLEFKQRPPKKVAQPQRVNKMEEKKDSKPWKPKAEENYDYDEDDRSEYDSVEYEETLPANRRDAGRSS